MAVWDWVTTAADNDDADAAINWAEGQAPSTVNDSARSMMARISHWLNTLSGNVTMGGASNAYTLTTGESLSAYPSNFRVLWQPNADSTGAVTLNVDAIGAKKVYMPDGTQAGSGDLDADSMYDVAYDGALDSASGGFKIIGFPDTTLTAADYLTAANNLSDLASASTARSNLGLGTMAVAATADYAALAGAAFTGSVTMAADLAVDTDTLFVDVSTDRVGIGTTSPSVKLEVNGAAKADTIDAHTPIGGISTGTLDATNLGHGTNLSGNITIPSTIGAAQQTIGPLNSGGASRTITRGSGLSMYVNGTNVASCTLAARGLAVIWFQSATICYVSGDVY